MSQISDTAEQQRLDANAAKAVPLELWGPYLSERQWGTVREDYSANGDAWNYFSHDQSRSRVYRWGEDGLAGISDYGQNLCFAIALWNGQDPILKERLFGLTNGEGNHGEDVKELYYYLDNLPTHYYMKYLYKYPQQAFPYEELVKVNRNRSKLEPEYEILDTGAFKNNAYFDVVVEYAKADKEDLYIKISIHNRNTVAAPFVLLPTIWFRNQWQYGGVSTKPQIRYIDQQTLQCSHEKLGDYYFYFQNREAETEVFFTENESNTEKLFGLHNKDCFVKDAFHDAVIHQKNTGLLTERKMGTKAAPVYRQGVGAGEKVNFFLRLSKEKTNTPFKAGFEQLFEQRKKEADDFYEAVLKKGTDSDKALIQRAAFAGLLWSKQYYHYDVEAWLAGEEPGAARLRGRNSNWKSLKNQDVIIMPDKWEYPWYAAWDLAFHCVAMAHIDPVFAKNQLIILTREWYMDADGQIPAYEWDFSDVNPPVQAFAALRVYQVEKDRKGEGDILFLKKIFHKLIINFTWWANRKDATGNNVFEGGFLGLDNIGVFNRSTQLPGEIALEQTDGTSWMAMYALNLMDMAIEIAATDPAFEDSATKFYEHFVLIAEALNDFGLWDKEDRFYYDLLNLQGTAPFALKLRSVVGLTPLFAVSVIQKEQLIKLPDFKKRVEWLHQYLEKFNRYTPVKETSDDEQILLSLIDQEKLVALLNRMLDEEEFLSAGGIRALSGHYRNNPFRSTIAGVNYEVYYDPGDSTSGLFGGNSNWRGPIWMPINYLLIKAIQKYGSYYKNTLKVEYPSRSGNYITLEETAEKLTERNLSIFIQTEKGERMVHGQYNWFYQEAGNEDLVLFYEYFHGDSGRGVGASHQTGWTSLIVDLLAG